MKYIENDPKKLKQLKMLLSEYSEYIRRRESQQLGAEVVDKVWLWVGDNLKDLEP